MIAKLAAALAVLVGSMPLGVEPPAPADPVRVIVLGTLHMGAQADALNPTVTDLLGERRQAEIEELVESLAEFKPTKVAIETPPSSPALQEQFERYVRGELELQQDERHQVAFRLAQESGLTQVHGVDHDQPIDVEALLGWAHQNGQGAIANELLSKYGELTAQWSADSLERSTMTEIYRVFNSPETDESIHNALLAAIQVGSDREPVGANLLSRWYDRNIRIAANIVHLAEPGDRILVLIGANHRKLLIDFLRDVPHIEVVDARDYLGELMGVPGSWIHEPKQTRSVDTLERIVDAAGSLLDEKNFGDISISEIMGRAGMSVGTFYKRFQNKSALLPYLYERYDERLSAETGSLLSPDDWGGLSLAARVERIVEFSVDAYRANKGLWRAVLIHAASDPGIVTEAHRRKRRTMVRDIITLLLERSAEMSHPDPEAAAEFSMVLLFSTCKDQILLEERSHGTRRISDQRLKAQLTRALLTFLGVRVGKRSR